MSALDIDAPGSLRLHLPGGRVRVLTRGSGHPVVLLHGLGGIAEEVMAPLSFLASRYRLLAPDRPGYGRTEPAAARSMAADDQAEWLRGILDALGVSTCLLVAHSLAAAPALWFAHRYPQRLRGLVLVSPFCRPTMPARMPFLRLATAPVLGPAIRGLVVPPLARLLRRRKLGAAFAPNPVPRHVARLPFELMAQPSAVLAMGSELRAFNGAMIPLALRMRTIPVRTVLIAGGADDVAPARRHAAWAARRLPDSAGICLSGVGHMAHHVRPRMVAAALECAAEPGPKSAMGSL